jgi:membrane protein DedA with SNARE-associated domain
MLSVDIRSKATLGSRRMDSAIFGHVVTDLVSRFGYIAVFLLIFFECTGVPLPGEFTLVSAAIFAGTTHQLEIGYIIAAAAAGAVLGGNFGFWVGRRYGFALLHRYGPYIHLTESWLKIGQWLFRKYGGSIIFLGRFTALLRAYVSLLAGANKYPSHHFFVWNTSGGIVWALVYGAGGFFFGHSIKYVAGPVSVALLIATIVALIALWLVFKKHEGRLHSEAERSVAEDEQGLPLG